MDRQADLLDAAVAAIVPLSAQSRWLSHLVFVKSRTCAPRRGATRPEPSLRFAPGRLRARVLSEHFWFEPKICVPMAKRDCLNIAAVTVAHAPDILSRLSVAVGRGQH